MKNDKNKALDLLRNKAERYISADKNSISETETVEVKKIFHELQVYQLELEMQNDELQQTTQELERERTKFSNLFDLAPIGYLVTNKSAVIKSINKAGSVLLNAAQSSLIGKPILLYIHKEDVDQFYVFFKRLFSFSNSLSCQLRLIDSTKKIYNVQIEGNVLHSAVDPICYLTITDFTGKQQAEQELKEAKKTLEIALNASLTGIWEIDISTGKVYLDDFCCLLYGFKPDSFDERYDTMINAIHPIDRKYVDENIRKTIYQEKEFNIKFRTQHDDGSIRYIQARAQIIKSTDNRSRFIGTFIDISEKTVYEQEVIRVKEQQQQMVLAAGLQAEENEKKRISEVLHNGIAQMLYAIKLNIEEAKKKPDNIIFKQIQDLLNQSIKDIRNISFELAPSILTDFGLGATLEDLAHRLSNNQLSITTKVSNFSNSLEFQLQLNIFRIIQELISNSIKHAHADKIQVEVGKNNKLITISVSDNGVGFEEQSDTKVPRGIGLISIKNRLRLYKGTLKIESRPKAGSTVNISLKVRA